MSDFTQGPFSVAETRHKYDIVIRGPKNEPIALVLIARFSKKEGAANANLLAAAHDLLEALREMVAGDAEAIEDAERIGIPFPDETLATYNKACAAIAKATGERP